MKKLSVFVFFVFVLIFFLFSPRIALGAILFYDDFNDNDISDWKVARNIQWDDPSQPCLYQGSPATWKAVNGRVGIKIDGPGCTTELVPNNFNITEESGYSYNFEMEFTGSIVANRNVIFKYLNSSNWYDFMFYGSTIYFQKVVDSYYRLASIYYPFQGNQTYHFRIDFSENIIKLFINGVQIWRLEDSPPYFSGGTIGLQASVGADPDSEVWFDNVTVTSLEPIPTPPPTTKVVMVPGLGASWNADAILNCKMDGYSGDWVLAPYAADVYTPLLSTLGEKGKPFYYDWRKDVRNHTANIQSFINSLISAGEKVHLVGHSLGGLVGRAYLENQTTNSKLDRLLTVGSPHQGTALAYPVWSGGDIWTDNFIDKVALTILLKRCGGLLGNDRETIQRAVPSIQNLLPISDYLQDKKTGVLKPVGGMSARNNWLPTNLPTSFYGVNFGTLSGNGSATLKSIIVKDPTSGDIKLGRWLDGKPINKEKVNEGDGTVLLSSSQLEGATSLIINQTHGGLVTSNEGISKILDFLGMGTSNLSLSYTEPKSALIVVGYPSTFWVVDQNGKIIKDTDGMVSLINPRANKYKFGLLPKSSSTLFIVAQFLENGRVLWKEYNLKNILPKTGAINFDPANPQEDALQLIP